MNNRIQSSAPNFPAFPFPGFDGGGMFNPQPSNSGMSFRDYVAVRAMQNMLLNDEFSPEGPSRIASLSYGLADAMLAARES
jgi:hypothetical protein